MRSHEITKATNDIRRLYKTAKADGFIKDDFDTAFSLQGEGGEAVQKNKIARKVTIARYLGLLLVKGEDLIVQDGGIYYYTRAMGFSFAD